MSSSVPRLPTKLPSTMFCEVTRGVWSKGGFRVSRHCSASRARSLVNAAMLLIYCEPCRGVGCVWSVPALSMRSVCGSSGAVVSIGSMSSAVCLEKKNKKNHAYTVDAPHRCFRRVWIGVLGPRLRWVVVVVLSCDFSGLGYMVGFTCVVNGGSGCGWVIYCCGREWRLCHLSRFVGVVI